MQLLFTLLLLSVPLATTSPTPSLPARSCTTIFPSSIQQLDSAHPDVYGNSSMLMVKSSTNASQQTKIYQYLSFAIPSGSYGCQLSITDHMSKLNSSSAPVSQTLSIISLPASSCSQLFAWNDVMNRSSSTNTSNSSTTERGMYSTHFGTVELEKGGHQVVNSRACPSEEKGETESGVGWLGFVVGYPEDDFEDGNGGALDEGKWWVLQQDTDESIQGKEKDGLVSGWGGAGNGVFLTFGC